MKLKRTASRVSLETGTSGELYEKVGKVKQRQKSMAEGVRWWGLGFSVLLGRFSTQTDARAPLPRAEFLGTLPRMLYIAFRARDKGTHRQSTSPQARDWTNVYAHSCGDGPLPIQSLLLGNSFFPLSLRFVCFRLSSNGKHWGIKTRGSPGRIQMPIGSPHSYRSFKILRKLRTNGLSTVYAFTSPSFRWCACVLCYL